MKHNFKYIFFIMGIFFFHFTVNASKNFKEDCDQERGLVLLEKIQTSFKEFESSLNNYEETRDKSCSKSWEDEYEIHSLIKNRISIAFNSAKSTFEIEKYWDSKDKKTISAREIQKVIWESTGISLISNQLKLYLSSHPFKQEDYKIHWEAKEILQQNLREFIKIMSEEGDIEDKEQVKVYLKHEKLKNKRKEEIQKGPKDFAYLNDVDFQIHSFNQQAPFKKLLESASVSEISGLPKFLTENSVDNDLRSRRIPLLHQFYDISKLADEIIEIYFQK